MNKEYKLCYPYYLYPNAPCGAYNDLEVYRNESIRLLHFLNNYKPDNKTFFNLIIGSAAEGAFTNQFLEDINGHWRQLFPYHIEYFLDNMKEKKNNNYNIQIIVISPDQFMNDEKYVPQFINKTMKECGWTKINKSKYFSRSYNITVNLFCTLMPHYDSRNSRITQKMLKICNDSKIYNDVLNIIQSKEDNKYTKVFYKTLEKVFDDVNDNNGIVVCISYAVFNIDTPHACINNYKMFSKIKNLFPCEKIDKRLLSEWKFNFENYDLTIFLDKYPLLKPTINYLVPHDNGFYLAVEDDGKELIITLDA